MDKQA